MSEKYDIIAFEAKHFTEDPYAIHISAGNSKLGKIYNFSLPPGVSCTKPANDTCFKLCYARKSYKAYPTVRKNWDDNYYAVLNHPEDAFWRISQFFGWTRPKFFRLHVAGDFFSVYYATMWMRIAQANPNTLFLAFTKNWDVVRQITPPDNFSLVLSDWPGNPVPEDLANTYRIAYLNDGKRNFDFAFHCTGRCESCFNCLDNTVTAKDIVFNLH